MLWSACGMWRASASISAIVCSATATLLASGQFSTSTPHERAVLTSIVSSPEPARPITRRRAPASIRRPVTFVALRTISASYSPMMRSNSSAAMP